MQFPLPQLLLHPHTTDSVTEKKDSAMTSKPLVFQFQHLLWQQRVMKERGTELRIKDEDDMFRTFTETLPG